MKGQAGILLVTCNFLELTRPCLASLLRVTEEPYRLLVVDNNSRDGTPAYLASLGVEVIASKADLSIPVAVNTGLKRLLEDPEVAYLAWIHNDMIFYPDWLTNLTAVLDAHPDIGKVAPHNFQGDPAAYSDAVATQFMRDNRDRLFPGHGGPWVTRRDAIEAVGYLDEGYVDCGGYEDWDYNNQMLARGYRVMITWGSVVWHQGMGTRQHLDTRAAAAHNGARYVAKWGVAGPKV